jgi:hypothetical protein
MEIFLAVTSIAALLVLIVATLQEPHAFLCQQEVTTKNH